MYQPEKLFVKRVRKGVRLVQGAKVVVLSRRFVAGVPDALVGSDFEIQEALSRLADETTNPWVQVSVSVNDQVYLIQEGDDVRVGLRSFLAKLPSLLLLMDAEEQEALERNAGSDARFKTDFGDT